MIKLICSDVDGTLVPDGTRDINPELFDVIQKLRAKGIHFTIASGRPVTSISSLFKPIEDKLFFVALGGAVIATSKRGLFEWCVDQTDVREMVRQARQIPGCEIQMNAAGCSYLETQNEQFRQWTMESYGTKCELMDDLLAVEDHIISLSLYDSAHQVEQTFAEFIPRWENSYKVVTAGTMWLDIQRQDVNKGRAIAYLQDSLGITPEETMVFGDQRNDIEMLQQAYHSYAVANALDEVKAAARFTTDRCDEDGVLKVLKTLL